MLIFYSIGAVLYLKASEEGGQLVQQGDGAVTGPRWGFVFCNGLYPLPEAHSVSAETMRSILSSWNTECSVPILQESVDLSY